MRDNLVSKKLISVILCVLLAFSMAACSLGRAKESGIQSTESTTVKPSVSKLDIGENTDLSKYVFVGDSRFVGMKNALKGYIDQDIEVVAKVGEGLKWLKTVAPGLYNLKGKTIIFNFGVNDLYNAAKYVEFYNGMPEEFMKDNTLVIMSVNPVDESKEAEFGFSVKNTDIEKFNKTIRSGLNKQYFCRIDTNTYIQLGDFMTTDGLHYYNHIYRMIFEYTVKCCETGDLKSL